MKITRRDNHVIVNGENCIIFKENKRGLELNFSENEDSPTVILNNIHIISLKESKIKQTYQLLKYIWISKKRGAQT